MARSSAPATASSSFFAPRTSSAKASSGSSSDNTKFGSPMGRVCYPPRQLPPLAPGVSWISKIRYLTPNRSSWILHIPIFCRSVSKHQPHDDNQKSLLSFKDMWKTRPEQQHSLLLFGRKVLENRYSAMYSKNQTVGTYTYSGSSRPCKVCDVSQPHEKHILDLFASADAIARDLLSPTGSIHQSKDEEGFVHLSPETAPKPIYNACLVNWYTPEHTIGLHSDNESEMDTSWPIFSLSWGGPRRFLLRPKAKHNKPKSKEMVHEVLLKDGDLLVMGGKCQDEFKHEIPKVRWTRDGLVGNRISWTIRRMKQSTKVKAQAQANTHKASTGGEKAGAMKRTHEESSRPFNPQVAQNPDRPRKKAAVYNPYARG